MTRPCRFARSRRRLIACWRYTGRWTESNYRDNEKLLREQIAKRGLAIRGEPILARYNAPFTPWFMRRNEVHDSGQTATEALEIHSSGVSAGRSAAAASP